MELAGGLRLDEEGGGASSGRRGSDHRYMFRVLLGVTIVTPIRNDHGRFRSPHANVLGRLVPNCLPT